MSDLTNVFGGPWSPPEQKNPDPPEVQMADAMIAAGISPPAEIIADGKLHRFDSGTKGKPGAGKKPGYYVLFNEGVPCGMFGCWRAGIQSNFRADIGRQLTAAEEMAAARRSSEMRALREAEREKERENAAETVAMIWAAGMVASPDHPYLSRKGIAPHGARITGDGRIMVPLYDAEDKLSSLQYIAPDGEKRYHQGAATKGCYWTIGTNASSIYIAEGFATAATIHEVTGCMVAVAYSAGNLTATAEAMHEKYPGVKLTVVADNDASGTGRNYAEQACARTGAAFVMPPILGDANDYQAAGHDLAALLNPPKNEWLVSADEFCQQNAPVKWLLKGWVQDNALIMVHGPSGSGKTFLVMEWALTIASGASEWDGRKVTQGQVVYLAGEGHHGLKSRIAAWKDSRKIDKLNLWLSRSGCDLNTREGCLHVSTSIRSAGLAPSLIVVDTLHRFLAGDENSAQDAKGMLDACALLMQEFSCSVILVHHTGVGLGAQDRARGSSAWRAALDGEVSVIQGNGHEASMAVQKKAKDSELQKPIYFKLKPHTIPGWLDDDGEPVTSCVIAIAEEPVKRDEKSSEALNQFAEGWKHGGREYRLDKPYVSRSAMKDYISSIEIVISDKVLNNKVSNKGSGAIAVLIAQGTIAELEHGWVVIDEVQASAMELAYSIADD